MYNSSFEIYLYEDMLIIISHIYLFYVLERNSININFVLNKMLNTQTVTEKHG